MEITLQKGDFTAVEAEALVLFHFEQDDRLLETTAAVNDAAGSIIGQVIEAGDFRGEHLEHLLLYSQGSMATERILLMGLGRREEFGAHALREAAAQSLRTLRDRRQPRAVLPIPFDSKFPLDLEDTAEACVLGGMLGLYQFTELRTRDLDNIKDFDSLIILSQKDSKKLAARVDRAKAMASGIYLARDRHLAPKSGYPHYFSGESGRGGGAGWGELPSYRKGRG
jgi:leucyl aminopeptidase